MMPARSPLGASASPVDSSLEWNSAWARHLVGRGTMPSAAIAAGQPRCEQLVADLAARFVIVEPDAIDGAIADGIRRLAELLQVDRATLWEKSAGHAEHASPEAVALMATPQVASKLDHGEAVWFRSLDDVFDRDARETIRQQGIRSAAVVPVPAIGRAGGTALVLFSLLREHDWTPAIIGQIRLAANVFGLALARTRVHATLAGALGELQRLRESEASELPRRSIAGEFQTSPLIATDSAAIRATLEQIRQVAPTPATVLLLGETGTGKEVLAQAIHDLSPRRHRQMIRVNCGAIPAALIESELFGRERGAYTGAITRQIGRFEAAHQSTIFLDEIGELPADIQVKLLRVIQERVIERLGSTQSIKVDVRIIAATNRNLERAVEDKSFREDLFYRLNVFPVTVPPLRDRVEDVPSLVWAFIDEFSKSFGRPIESICKESMRQLQAYSWPGNVRELRNLIERAVILATGRKLTVAVPQMSRPPEAPRPVTLATIEADHIRATLESASWRIRGAGGAAERLGLKPTTLESRMAKMGLVRPGR